MFYFTLVTQTLPRLARTLSRSSVQSVYLYVHFLAFLFFKRVWKNGRAWSFDFIYQDTKFSLKLFEGSPDIAALKEIFLDGEYGWDDFESPKTIIDLGAHTGNTALYFHLKYPHAQIYAVEASPKNYARLVENVNMVPNIHPVFGAVSDTDGILTFYESTSSLGSSIHKREGSNRPVEVPSFTLSTLCANLGLHIVDLMKIDIEGAEEKLFTTIGPESFAHNYMIEVHHDLMEHTTDFAGEHFKSFKSSCRELGQNGRYLLYAAQK